MKPRFILIDESLCNLAGHHATFARLMLAAAERRGLTPVLAAHGDFAAAESLPPTWEVQRCFSQRIYDDPLLMPLEASAGAPRFANLSERVRRLKKRSRRSEYLARRRDEFGRLLNDVRPAAGDQVLVAAASELSVRALAGAWSVSRPHVGAPWHLLFHFPMLAGEPHEYARQTVRAAWLRHAVELLERYAQPGCLHWHTTTPHLAQQFDTIVPGRFQTLGYPIDPAFAPRSKGVTSRPFQITFAGDARREKGYQHLAEIVQALAPELRRGDVRFVIQSNLAFRLPCRRHNRPVVASRDVLATMPEESVRLLTAPLGDSEYAQLIQSTDIALLPYDAAHYYTRCSGVLLEMLLSGVPAIVPSRGWMADTARGEGGFRRVVGNPSNTEAACALTFDRPEQIADRIRVMAGEYARFRAAAERRAAGLRVECDPLRLIEALLSERRHGREETRPQVMPNEATAYAARSA